MMNKIAIIQFGGTGDLTKKKLLPAYKNYIKIIINSVYYA